MTLPILKLPYLVIQQLLQTMGFLDLFLLTRTSTKMKRIIKNSYSTQKQKLFVRIGESIKIQIQSKANEEYVDEIYVELKKYKPKRRNTFNMGIGSMNRLPSAFWVFDDGQGFVKTYWNDTKAGCIELCNELFDVFRTSLFGTILNLEEVDNYQNEVNWVNSTFPALIFFTIEGKCSFQDYIWIIKNAKAQEALNFEMELTEYPEDMGNLEVIPFELDYIHIKHGRWISLQQLQAIKSNFIGITDVNPSDSHVNEFLRNLKNSKEKPNFKQMDFYFSGEADPNVVLEGLFSEEEGASTLEDIFDGFVFKIENGLRCKIQFCMLQSDQPDVEIFGFKIDIEG